MCMKAHKHIYIGHENGTEVDETQRKTKTVTQERERGSYIENCLWRITNEGRYGTSSSCKSQPSRRQWVSC